MSLIRIPATIAASASVSDELPLENGYIPVALSMPDAWTAADITVQAKNKAGDWVDVYDDSGTEVSISAAADRWIVLTQVGDFAGFANIRLRSGTSGTPVNQAADRVIGVALRVV